MAHDHRFRDHQDGAHNPAETRVRRPSRHDPETVRRAERRARAIVDSRPRTELVGAAEFLYALLPVTRGFAADAPAAPSPGRRGRAGSTGRT